MIRRALIVALIVALAACGRGADDGRTKLTIQRFFGTCDAAVRGNLDWAKADGECGIMTTMVNRFRAENPDIDVRVNIVTWPGYDQLVAQLAAGDIADLVTMHGSVMPDYKARGLLVPLDDGLREARIDPRDFTPIARASATLDGRIYGMPLDSWAPLWHINMNEFRKAGLVRDGQPILPRNPDELYAQAAQFRRATGKPYIIQVGANEVASYTRNFYTFLAQQDSPFFADPRHIRLRTPEARNALRIYRTLYARDLTSKNQDYSAATAAFLNGQGGIFSVGTWMISTFDQESRTPGRPLHGGYAVVPLPQLFPQRPATFADAHLWVMPTNLRRPPAQRRAALRFLKFFADNDFQWARTGHLPAFQPVIDSAPFKALPRREHIARLPQIAVPLPRGVRRQFPIETIIGEESVAAITGRKPIDRTLADMERRINELLDNS